MHLMSVIQDSPAWAAVQSAWKGGATLAASSAGAMVLADPMIDQRGWRVHAGPRPAPRRRRSSRTPTAGAPIGCARTQKLAGASISLLAIDEETAAIREPNGVWKADGKGHVLLHRMSDAAPHLPGLLVHE